MPIIFKVSSANSAGAVAFASSGFASITLAAPTTALNTASLLENPPPFFSWRSHALLVSSSQSSSLVVVPNKFPRDDDDDDDDNEQRCGGGRSKSELDDFDAFATNHRLSKGVDTKKRDWNDERL